MDPGSEDLRARSSIEIDLRKQEYLNDFLYVKAPVPRSYKMIDRLKLKEVTLSKGRMFGPDDYVGFTLITFFILFILITRKRQYETFTFENLENVNVYNALKPSEVNKIYNDAEISPLEQTVIGTNGKIVF
jgi:hypothetical protein